MTLYGTMACFIKLSTKINGSFLIYTSDSEHILENAMCSENKQPLYEVFHLHKKDYITVAHVTQH